MARPVTVTKERILSAALDLVRSGGPSLLTARNLCARLGCGASAIFSSFGSIQGVRDAVREEARELYREAEGAPKEYGGFLERIKEYLDAGSTDPDH